MAKQLIHYKPAGGRFRGGSWRMCDTYYAQGEANSDATRRLRFGSEAYKKADRATPFPRTLSDITRVTCPACLARIVGVARIRERVMLNELAARR